MPNGGDVPCCADCRYAKKSPDTRIIKCKKHDIKVTSAFYMFCKNLSFPSHPESENFALDSKIVEGVMYTWAGYYTHKELPLAPIETYAIWSDEEKESHRIEKSKAWEEEYRSKHGDDWF